MPYRYSPIENKTQESDSAQSSKQHDHGDYTDLPTAKFKYGTHSAQANTVNTFQTNMTVSSDAKMTEVFC
jgi:hypothetical protein